MNWLRETLTFSEREYLSWGINMLTKSLKISDTTKTEFFQTEVLAKWSKNMTKLLPCRIKQYFGHFNMFTLHKCSDTWPFRHLSNHTFCSHYFWNISAMRLIYFFKVCKISCRFQKCRKMLRKYFQFFR